MRFLVDSLRGEALDEFAVELFGEKDDGLDDGLFHSLDVLGWVLLETEVELFVVRGNWANGIVKEKNFEEVEEQLAYSFFGNQVFPSLSKALIKEFQDNLDEIRFLDKVLKSTWKDKYSIH